jgi:hypothetical protein
MSYFWNGKGEWAHLLARDLTADVSAYTLGLQKALLSAQYLNLETTSAASREKVRAQNAKYNWERVNAEFRLRRTEPISASAV